MSAETSDRAREAIRAIHEDLADLRRRRSRALALVAIGALALLGGFAALPEPHEASPRDVTWWVASLFLLASATFAVGTAMGIPHWSRSALITATLAAALGAIAGAALIIQPAVGPDAGFRFSCLFHGTLVGLGTFALLRVTTGRLWRRFPDGSVVASIGGTAAGLAYLVAQCGTRDPGHVVISHLPVLLSVFVLTQAVLALRNTSQFEGT